MRPVRGEPAIVQATFPHEVSPVASPTEREMSRDLVGALDDSTGSYELVIAAVAAALLGWWIDSVLGTFPVLLIVFAVAAFIGAGYSLRLRYQQRMGQLTDERTAMRDPARRDPATRSGTGR